MSHSGAEAPPGVGWGSLLAIPESGAKKDSRMHGWSSRLKLDPGMGGGKAVGNVEG